MIYWLLLPLSPLPTVVLDEVAVAPPLLQAIWIALAASLGIMVLAGILNAWFNRQPTQPEPRDSTDP
ncbi:MAG: hypothetical protein NW237_03985 [Cyanobacteriota bacterium]|nr:hypothetical protein [Cyanobacteriota bacterium]